MLLPLLRWRLVRLVPLVPLVLVAGLGWVYGAAAQTAAQGPGSATDVAAASTALAFPPLRIVGGLSGLKQYSSLEEPFWSQDLVRLSHGKYHAEIVPFDRAGVPGQDMLRLIQLGVLPFSSALLSNVSALNPALAAPDLAGLNPDITSLRRNVAAFRPYLEKSLREDYGIVLLAVYTYPAQILFCKNELHNLSALAGRRVRVASATQADFVTAFGATPVLLPLNQVVPNIQSGNTECAITGAMSGNTIDLQQYTHYLHSMPVTWGVSLFGANQNAWHALPADLRNLLTRELHTLENTIWDDAEHDTAEGVDCNTGGAACLQGHKATMVLTAASNADELQRQSVFSNVVLKHWLQRCGNRCAALWNSTIGQSSGIRAVIAP